MTNARSGLRTFCLSFLVMLGFTGIIATAAQAAEYTIGGKTLTELGIEEESVTGMGGPFSFSFTVASFPTKIDCTSALLDKGSIAPEGKFPGAIFSGEILFSGCELFFNGTNKVCGVTNVHTVQLKGDLVTHSKEVYSLLLPQTGESFMLFTATGLSCPILGEGKFLKTLAGLTEAGERIDQPLTFSPLIATLMATNLTYGTGNTVSVSGKMSLALSGPNKGSKWAAIP